MKLKNLVLACGTAMALSFGASSHAQSFADCVSTDLANFDGTVVDAALATPALSTLVDVVVAAGLVDALNDADNITVYAPTNDAFAAVPGGILDAITSDVELLTSVLVYHVSAGNQDPRKWVKAQKAKTSLEGASVFFHRQDGSPRVNQAAVACQGVKTDHGTVWVIDSVLLP